MLAKFHDPAQGGFYDSAAGARELILRCKDDYDGAEPSGNSVAVLALLRLAAITARKEFPSRPKRPCACWRRACTNCPKPCRTCFWGWSFICANRCGRWWRARPEHPETRALLRAIHSVYQPGKVVLGNSGPVDPFARSLPAAEGPLVYLCSGSSCQPPSRDPEIDQEIPQGLTRPSSWKRTSWNWSTLMCCCCRSRRSGIPWIR